jgi:hypothetical protein
MHGYSDVTAALSSRLNFSAGEVLKLESIVDRIALQMMT